MHEDQQSESCAEDIWQSGLWAILTSVPQDTESAQIDDPQQPFGMQKSFEVLQFPISKPLQYQGSQLGGILWKLKLLLGARFFGF